MSLFAAYADKTQEDDTNNQEKWLKNTSFAISPLKNTNLLVSADDPSSDEEHNDSEDDVETPIEIATVPKLQNKNDDLFFIDKKCVKDFLKMKTFSKHSVAKYHRNYYLRNYNSKPKRKFRRYYECVPLLMIVDEVKADKVENTNEKNDLSQMTGTFNKTLFNDPHNIETWLKFIEFQNTIFAQDRIIKKGSLAKGIRANAEKKLCILEKALSKNPNSEALMRKRIEIISAVYPSDEIQNQLKILLDKDQSNIVNWQGYIEATQCSMSHCNATQVLNLYSKCLSVLHKIRRNATLEKRVLEEHILRILYQCGLFLKQSGLYERLYTLLKMYLDLNLSPADNNCFNIPLNFDEQQLIELEDLVLKSKLPTHELWLRTEKLRESCHWLPTNDQTCEDPQRLVFTEDVVELIHPISENVFRLIVTVLTLLKVPLLPHRHCTVKLLGLDHVPWALDSIETLLPIYLPMYSLDLNLKNFMGDNKLAVGPQYLKVLPGQVEYLSFILELMCRCINCMKNEEKIALTLWWFRFQRLLIILDKQKQLKLANVKKTIKSKIKNFLKLPENRSNVLFYIEYALIEKESDTNSCIKILEISLDNSIINFSSLNASFSEIAQCHLMRVYVEVLLLEENNEKAKKSLINFICGKKFNSAIEIDEETVNRTNLIFKHNTIQIFDKHLTNLTAVEHFLPIFFCDWVILNSWFIYLTKGALSCGIFLEEILEKLENYPCDSIYTEIIYEFYVSILFKFCLRKPEYGLFKPLNEILYKAVQLFPDNIFLLAAVSKEHLMVNSLGPNFWKIKNLLIKTEHALPVLFLVYTAQQICENQEEKLMDTITGSKLSLDSNFKNVMYSLFRQITQADMCTRRCGLIWRLYLQFVYKHFDRKLIRNTYYSAMEECPWLKALYIDAAVYIPEDLGQIQDLLIEKELRLHVTPEELDILKE